MKTRGNFFKGTEEQIQRPACKQKMSLEQIKDEIQLPCVSRTIRNALHINQNDVYKKLKGKSPHSERHIDSLINFTREHLTAGTNRNDVFSDDFFYLND
ncbi:hypothetical protein AVEN_10006-1 [Araneus ventricosus]|uniref:Uncharacterized protein n=1 Tax=Araneus ventricosus TaxID=182803 RepID=A0A4Y2LUL7_ARAVE|nr:hypothetical protein AVEN_10006-1 [Araneus ventricosus]